MKLCEFFELYEEAPVAQAFSAVRQHLNRHFDTLPPADYSPWTLRLGKGGLKRDGSGYYDGPEQSLYRHCTEVAVLATWLCYHAWQVERPPFSSATDIVAALRTLFAIAFAHDADKRLDAKSKSPTADEVQAIYAELDIGAWAELTAAQLHHAVSRVENRGLGQALFGSVGIDPLMEKLAELVHEADNLLSRAARNGGTPQAFINLLNQDLARLHRLYAVPDRPLRLIRLRHHPIVLQRLQEFLGQEIFFDCDFYPLVFARRGEWLDLSISEEMDFTAWLDRFESRLAGSRPSFKVAATIGTMTWFSVGSANDLIDAVRNDPRQAQLLLRVTAKDWDTAAPLVNFWIMHAGAPFSTTPLKGKLSPVLKAGGEIPPEHPLFWRAASLAAVMPDRAAAERLLDIQQGVVGASLQQNGIAPDTLDGLSLRTLAALQASLLNDAIGLPELLDGIQGEWPRTDTADPGVTAIVQCLRDQLELTDSLTDSVTPAPTYAQPASGGTCLICGTPTPQVIESSRMKLAGVKASSFSNRIGHSKHLWSEKGDNFICPVCLQIQGLLLTTYPSLRSTPMLIATPVRHLLDTHTDDRPKGVLRSFDAISKDNRRRILPWNADAHFDEPLLFEERQTALDEVIDQMHRLACYAALSGEPVHAFIASQRECHAAFLYEGTPELLKELLADLTGNEDGIHRHCLERLVHRLELFKALLAEYDGMTGLQALPGFGWWGAAFVMARAARRQNATWNPKSIYFVELARQEYPMSEYDDWLDTVVHKAAETQTSLRNDSSGAEWTLMLRMALETYQKHYAFGSEKTQDAIAQRLRDYLSRRYGDRLYKKDLDARLQAFSEAAYALLAKADQQYDLESGFVGFLLAAYEGGLRRAVRERWKNRDAASANDAPSAPDIQTSLNP